MASKTNGNTDSGIQVISRAAAILRALKGQHDGLSLGEISQATGLPRSTVQRIVNALQAEGLAVANANGRGLRLGPEVSALAEGMRHDMAQLCRPLLTALSQETGETADLSVMRGAAMLFLDQVPGMHRLRTVSAVGQAFPLTTTANGRACLAALPEARAKALAQNEWARRGMRQDLDGLLAMLALIRRTGIAYDEGDHTPGICAVGFCFRDQGGELYAISVPVPESRYGGVRFKVEAALVRTAEEVRALLAG